MMVGEHDALCLDRALEEGERVWRRAHVGEDERHVQVKVLTGGAESAVVERVDGVVKHARRAKHLQERGKRRSWKVREGQE